MQVIGLIEGLYYKSHEGRIFKVITQYTYRDSNGFDNPCYILRDLKGNYHNSPMLADYSQWECVIPDSECIIKEVK